MPRGVSILLYALLVAGVQKGAAATCLVRTTVYTIRYWGLAYELFVRRAVRVWSDMICE